MRLLAGADHVARQQRQLTWNQKWHHEEARVVVATGRYAPRPMVNKRDPFLFRPPVCPPAACFFFLSSLLYPSPGHLKRTSSSFSSHISILSHTKNNTCHRSHYCCVLQLPEELLPRLTHRTTRFHCFQTTTAPLSHPLYLLRTSLFFGIVLPGSIS